MKRLLYFALWALSICFIAFSCSKESSPKLTMTGSRSFSFSNDGGTQTIAFSCNQNWSVSSSESWVRVSPSSGTASSGDVTATITVSPNTTYDPRSATITIKVADLSESITISQAMGNGLIVPKKQYDLTNAEQTIEVEVQKNVSYSVTIDDAGKDWITQTGTRALSSEKIAFKISANTSYDDREGHITIKQTDGNLSETITVKQGQTNGLFVTSPEYDLSNGSHTLSVEVKANVEFEVTSQADWISYVETKALKPSSVVLNIQANETYSDRIGTVKVKQKNGDLEGIITINQKQTDGLFVSPTSFDLTNQEQSVDIEVKNNVNFSIVIPDDEKNWISVLSNSATKGMTEDKVILAITQNTTYDDRETSVTFKQVDGPLSETVKIKQAYGEGLIVEKTSFEIGQEGGTIEVAVRTNVEYSVTPAVDWIHFVETKALSGSTVILSVDKNKEFDNREGTVLIKQKNGELKSTVTIRQKQLDDLNVNNDVIEVPSAGKVVDIDVTTNVEYDVFVSDDCNDWIKQVPKTKGLRTETVQLQIQANPKYVERSGLVKIIDKSNSIERHITIKQAQLDVLILEKQSIESTSADTTATIKVKSNINYNVISPASWLIVADGTIPIDGLERDENGLAVTDVTFTLSKNITYKERNCELSFSSEKLSSPINCNIKQTQFGYVVFEGYKYKTITYGDREWMAENLRAKFGREEGNTLDNWGAPQKSPYDYPWVKDEYGLLYQMDGLIYSSGYINICPDGWHVTNANDWEDLFKLSNSYASKQWLKKSLGGSDDFSFGGNYGEWASASYWFNFDFGQPFSEWTKINESSVYYAKRHTDYGPYPSVRFQYIRCVRGNIAPEIQNLPVSNISNTSATLKADILNDPSSSIAIPIRLVNKEYNKITKAGFRYGTDIDNLNSTVYSSNEKVNVEAKSLIPGAIYYYQPFVEYQGGDAPVYGDIMSFRTYYGTLEYQGYTYFTTSFNGLEIMSQNLQASSLNDGTPIPYVSDNQMWKTTTDVAQCIRTNDETLLEPYGRLYNQYAVCNEKICPEGWRLPMVSEIVLDWETKKSLFGKQNGVYCLSDNRYWANPTYCNNLSALSVLPSESRDAEGEFTQTGFAGGQKGFMAYFWAINTIHTNQFDIIQISAQIGEDDYVSSYVTNGNGWGINKNIGCAVRCVREL